jgi:hypothetical protein
MDTRSLVVGSRVESTLHGFGTVTFVGTDYVGIAFDGSGEALIRRDTLEREAPAVVAPVEPCRDELPWPESTFVPEQEDAQHFLGSHWDPFVEDCTEIIDRVPEIASTALQQTGYGNVHLPPREVPEDWPKGFRLVWPLRIQGLMATLRTEKEVGMIVSVFPFFATGSQHTLTLHEVSVWDGGLEAQITARWGEGEVTFFDTQYLINRAWYETGKDYDFIFSGVAYKAGPAKKHECQINRHPDQVAWMNQRRKEGEKLHKTTVTMSMEGAAMFLPVTGWDVDDYSFHAPVKSVTEFTDWLGQDGWRVCATVMRFGNEDGDLDILITKRAWSGAAPPQVGQDIEGQLWLQGYLWMPR